MSFVDVHAHLIHPQFEGEEQQAAVRAAAAGLSAVIVNGLEPASNRRVLQLCEGHSHLYPALGIYPVDAIAHRIDPHSWPYEWPPPTPFDVDAEIAFIDSVAEQLIAIGECGLDRYWVTEQDAEQERVLRALIDIALRHDKPVILHTRKAEARTFEILLEMGVVKADFHCFTGKLKLARRITEAGYYLSIPPAVTRDQTFQRFARELPADRLLTETDSPYMGPVRGERNEPANVPVAVEAMAKARGVDAETMRVAIAENFERLFGVALSKAP